MIELLNTLNALSPLGVIGLLAAIIYMLVTGRTASARKMDTMKDNDLHELPEIAATLRRLEISLTENFAYIKAKLNGR